MNNASGDARFPTSMGPEIRNAAGTLRIEKKAAWNAV